MRMLTTAAALAALIATGANAEPQRLPRICGDRQQLLDRMAEQYEEAPKAIGLGADGGVFEILVGPSGSWTMLVTYAGRPTCVVAVGKAFELAPVGEPS